MKVTVCFGSVRVLVPCGAGDLLVRDLVREATHRYKKATGQSDLLLFLKVRLNSSYKMAFRKCKRYEKEYDGYSETIDNSSTK
ncbi:unnamed protein product [Spodoptera littoralis]|uniref:Par3/HAL N-terminal domain-containing protein n=1 Tax=Spodoptera littoralis TaxID=7109 RepID=A0A9P0IHN1_SPOLI|nr:unnamed protein product [Spodoptera littoralis]CAH1646011.1 unnamed protein product [Spodoptera littoralis]